MSEEQRRQIKVKTSTTKKYLSPQDELEEKTALAKPISDVTLDTLASRMDLASVDLFFNTLPNLKNFQHLEKKRYKAVFLDFGGAFLSAMRLSVKLCSTQSDNIHTRWKITLRILWEFLQHHLVTVINYFNDPTVPPEERYEHLAYDRVSALAIADQPEYTPFNGLARSAFVIIELRHGRNKIIFDAYYALTQKFRALGWGREAKISDEPTQAIQDFKNYFQSFSPEISKAISQLPQEQLTYIFTGFVEAFKKGKNQDDAYLETVQAKALVKEALTEGGANSLLIPPLARIVCDYIPVTFFGDTARKEQAALQQAQKPDVSEPKAQASSSSTVSDAKPGQTPAASPQLSPMRSGF